MAILHCEEKIALTLFEINLPSDGSNRNHMYIHLYMCNQMIDDKLNCKFNVTIL